MASISFDGHSFLIDGKRLWLVSGVLDYARIPAALWRRRIRQAREAGLNCLAVSVMWNVHEPQPGVFRFDGRADLRKFVQMIGEEGMRCFLRPGPFVNGGWDGGGLPAWLRERGSIKDEAAAATGPAEVERVQVRQADPIFLQAVARYLDAVMEQVKDLQVTTPAAGPILLVQVEHEWFSHNPQQAEGYLEQLTRFLRESGCNVPLINTNNLWQQVPGTIDGWNGDQHVFTNCRQLRVLRPDAPCIVTSLPTGSVRTWGGGEEASPRTADHVLRRMAEVSAAGGMFNLDPFCGGTNFGFYGGRLAGSDDRFVTTSNDRGAPLSETGEKTGKYLAVKRLGTFLSQFDHMMANLTLNHQPTVSATHLSVVHQSGTHGHVVFILRDADDSRTREIELSTPDGQSLPVHMGDDNVAWVLLEANLDGVARMDLTNLRPWALVDRQLLVMFGPAGSDGIFSIDGVLRHVAVPEGTEPLVIEHDSLKIAVLNEAQIDAAYLSRGALHVGIAGFDDENQPLPHDDFATSFTITAAGKVTKQKLKGNGRVTLPKLGDWHYAPLDDYADGSAPRFATLPGPRSLGACGAEFGYGWYRIKLKRRASGGGGGGGKVNLLAPQAGDRLHLYQGGKLRNILGVGPGTTAQPLPLTLAADATLVVLADNLGRFSEDLRVDQPKGLHGELYDVKPIKLPRPDVVTEPRIDPFELSGYVPHCSSDERGPYPRYTYTVKLTGTSTPLILTLRGDRPRCVVVVNDQPVAIDVGRGVSEFHVLSEHLKRGNNRITLALIDKPLADYDPRNHAELFEVKDVLSAGGDWWYARWQLPDAAMYQKMPRATPNVPTFYRATFRMDVPPRPVMLELAGVSKGQIYFNGHNLGRYFLTTATGKKVGPQKRFYLPEPWFAAPGTPGNGANELIIFDEHGKAPTGSKLALP